jgi:predicted MPP superfamily phosphohydrolase
LLTAFLLTGLAALLAILGLWACWLEPRSLTVTRLEIRSPGWPKGAPALRIALLADLHAAGPHDTPARLAEVVARANAEAPDLVLLLGDYIDLRLVRTSLVPPEAIGRALAPLRAPLGVHAVLGNHDWEAGGARMAAALAAAGIGVLENAARQLRHGGHDFWLAGIGDAWSGADDLAATLEQVTDAAPVLAMTHCPDVFPEIPAQVALTVAGHTHGGQVRLPWLGALVVPSRWRRRYAYGHIVEHGRHLFVSRGLGHSLLPVRFLCPPEIALLTLCHAQAEAAPATATKALSLVGSSA